MSDQKPDQPRLYVRLGCALAVCLVPAAIYLAVNAWINVWFDESRRLADVAAGNRVYDQIADFKSGKLDRITVDGDATGGGMVAFLTAKGELGEAKPYKLQIWYSSSVDDFLTQLEGTRGLRSLILYKTDVTVAGIESIALLPDLEELSIAYIRETEGGSDKRLSNFHLESLAQSLAPLETAKSLKKLTLVGKDIPADEIDELRSRLPHCAVLVERGG